MKKNLNDEEEKEEERVFFNEPIMGENSRK